MSFTVTLADNEISVMLEVPNSAIAPEAFGTVIGVQLAAVFQLPFVGVGDQTKVFWARVVLGTQAQKLINKNASQSRVENNRSIRYNFFMVNDGFRSSAATYGSL
jgi:hypothetical protein